MKNDLKALQEARQEVIDLLGMERLIDSAGVITNFRIQNRLADATGLPLDATMELATRSLRAELRVDKYNASAHSPKGGWIQSVLSRIIEPFAPKVFRLVDRIGKK